MSAKVCASFPLSSSTILAAFTFETISPMTERSSSWGTGWLTKRFKARLSGSEMSGDSERWFVSSRGRGNSGPIWPNDSPAIPPESMSTGGAAASMRPFSSRNESGVDAGGLGSLECLSHSRQPDSLRYSPIDSTDKSYIEWAVSMRWSRGGKRTTYHHGSGRRGFHVNKSLHVLSNLADLEATASRLMWVRNRSWLRTTEHARRKLSISPASSSATQ